MTAFPSAFPTDMDPEKLKALMERDRGVSSKASMGERLAFIVLSKDTSSELSKIMDDMSDEIAEASLDAITHAATSLQLRLEVVLAALGRLGVSADEKVGGLI